MTEPTRAELESVNLQNLQWLESYTQDRPNLWVTGVDLVKCFTYDLLQLCNHVFLRERLAA